MNLKNVFDSDPAKADALASLVAEFTVLGNTVCTACSGFGHQERVCPTRGRISNWISSGGIHATIVHKIRRLVAIEHGNGLQIGSIKRTRSKTPRRK